MKTKSFPRRGDYVSITTGHDSLVVGTILKVTSVSDQGCQGTLFFSPDGQYAVGRTLNFSKGRVEPVTRDKRAEVLEKRALEVEEKATALTTEARDLRVRAKALRQFESDEMEIAMRVAEIMESSAPKADKLKRIADLEVIDELRS